MAFAGVYQNLDYSSEWSLDDMVEWVKRENGEGAIDRAGQLLVGWWNSTENMPTEKWAPAYHILANWRACHILPLNVIQAGLRGRIRRVEQNAIVAQRLKRFS